MIFDHQYPVTTNNWKRDGRVMGMHWSNKWEPY